MVNERTSVRQLRAEGLLYPEDTREGRPRTRGDCDDVPRPCPYVGCRHHLYLEAQGGSLKINFPDLEPDELSESCSLDVAEQGGVRLEDVGALMNFTRERCRQIQERGLERLGRRRQLRLVQEEE